MENKAPCDEERVEIGAEAARYSISDGGPKEVEYSTVDFSKWNRSQRGSEERQETTETEYAELHKEKTEEGQDGEILEDKEVVMLGQEAETRPCEQLGEGPVYSSVNDLMADI